MYKLDENQDKQIKKIGQKFDLVFVIIFGSAVNGKRTSQSDLDIGVLMKKQPKYQDFKKLYSAFSKVFKAENIDIRFLNRADPFFRFQVVKNGKLIYGDQTEFDKYFNYAYKSYVDDYLTLSDLEDELIDQKIYKLKEEVL
jgi:predicted nucleotidyltransferase